MPSLTPSQDLFVTSPHDLKVAINAFVNGDYIVGYSTLSDHKNSIKISNLSQNYVTIKEVGLCNIALAIPCFRLWGNDVRMLGIPAGGSPTLYDLETNLLPFNDTVSYKSDFVDYFAANPTVNSVEMDAVYYVDYNDRAYYMPFKNAFDPVDPIYAMRQRLILTANTFSKTIYRLSEAVIGSITIYNQGSFDVGEAGWVDSGWYRYGIGNDELSGSIGIFYTDAMTNDHIIQAGQSKTYSFSFTATINAEMQEYINNHPGTRSFALSKVKNLLGYGVINEHTSSGDTIHDANINEFVEMSMINVAYIAPSIYQPAIDTFITERSISGVLSDEGTDILTSIKLSTVGSTYPASFALTITDNNNVSYDITSDISSAITGLTRDDSLITNQYSNGSDYTFTLFFGDQFESATATYSISNAFANLHLSGQPTGGACFGGFSASTMNNPILESYYPIRAYSDLEVHGDISVVDGNNVSHSLVDIIYPVGSIYMSTVNANPSAIFPNTTWTQIQDTFLLSAGTDYTAGDTGGSKTHTHRYGIRYAGYYSAFSFENSTDKGVYNYAEDGTTSFNAHQNVGTSSSYVNSAATNGQTSRNMAFYNSMGNVHYTSTMPPYLVVYMWTRTA